MIVAACAAEGHPQETAAERVDGVFEGEVHEFVGGGGIASGEGEEAGGDDDVAAFGFGGGDEIAGELFLDEAVVGFVGIEGIDDVVAVAVSSGMG